VNERLPLFVFGTLRRGHENHHYLDGHYDRMLPATLHGYARVQPLMIARSSDSHVEGELYFLRDDEYDKTMAECDILEEIPPGKLIGWEYERKQVQVVTAEVTHQAWAYVMPESTFTDSL